MKIVVTGLECSGTKWMTELLRKHPDVTAVLHTSIPENAMPGTGFPELNSLDAVVWMVRYEPFRLKSVERAKYNTDRPPLYLPPQLYAEAMRLMANCTKPLRVVSYEILIGPFGLKYFQWLIRSLGLIPTPEYLKLFDPRDENRKYYEHA